MKNEKKRKEKFTETNIGLGKSKIKIMPGVLNLYLND